MIVVVGVDMGKKLFAKSGLTAKLLSRKFSYSKHRTFLTAKAKNNALDMSADS
jgi:hypothetical protein